MQDTWGGARGDVFWINTPEDLRAGGFQRRPALEGDTWNLRRLAEQVPRE